MANCSPRLCLMGKSFIFVPDGRIYIFKQKMLRVLFIGHNDMKLTTSTEALQGKGFSVSSVKMKLFVKNRKRFV